MLKLAKNLELPIVAQQFIDAFDKGNPVRPFSFELPLETK